MVRRKQKNGVAQVLRSINQWIEFKKRKAGRIGKCEYCNYRERFYV